MNNSEQQPNTSNLQTLETELALTKAEIEEFRKLPKEEQEKQKDEKLASLEGLQTKFDLAIQEAIRTGDIESAKGIKEKYARAIEDLEEIVKATERPELPLGAEIFEVIPDPEITSAEIAIKKLETKGFKVSEIAKEMLKKINWLEKKKSSYEIVVIRARDIFLDHSKHGKSYTYAEIRKKAQEFGLGIIPQALVPDIRLNYKNKNGKWMKIATELIGGRNGDLTFFNCYSDLSLNDDNAGGVDMTWHGTTIFFFSRK